MARSAFDSLPTSQEEDAFDPSQNVETRLVDPAAAPPRKQAALNRIKASDLSARGIPAYKTASGDVAPVTDETGGPLNAFNQKTGIAYDSKGAPKQISFDDDGPKVSDPFAKLPAQVDPKTGAIEKNGPGGIYQYLGQDPTASAAVKAKAADKELGATATLLGRKLTLDEHDLVQADKAQKTLHAALTTAVPALLDPKFHGADPETVHKAIDDSFDQEYATPEANKTSGFFSKNLSDDAQALRADIDRRKAQAHDTADKIFDVGDQVNQLSSSIETGRARERGTLDQELANHGVTQDGGGAAQPKAAQLYPPVEDWGRMLGGGHIKPDQAPDMIKTATETGGVPSIAAPAAMAAAHEAADAQKKAEALRESNPTLADQFEAVAKGILEGVGNGVAELVKSPLGQGVTGLADIATLGALGMNPEEQTKKMAAAITAANPTIEKKLEGTVGRTIGNFAGGVLPYVAATIASGGAAPAVNAALFFSTGYQHTLDDAKAHGASPLAAEGAALTNGSINAVLALPLGVVGKAYEAIFGDTAPKIVSRAIKNAYDTGGPGAVGSLLGQLSEMIKAGGEGSEKLRQEAVEGIGKVMAEIKKTPAQRALAVAKSAGIHAGIGGSVQTAQNLVSKTYNPDQGAFEGSTTAALGYGALAASSEGFKQVVDALKAKKALDIINSKKPGAPPAGLPAGPTTPAPTAPKGGGAITPTEGTKPSEPAKPTSGGIPPSTTSGEKPGAPAVKPPDKSGAEAQPVKADAPTTTSEPPATGKPAAAEEQPAPVLKSLKEAEQAYVEKGGHADRLDGIEKLKQLKETYPKGSDRLQAINDHFAEMAKPAESAAPVVTVDEGAHGAATSPNNELAEPSQAQKEAGNYQKGHVTVGGLDISIENPAGSKRKPEFRPLESHYGYIKGTVGADKDHVDIFVKQGTPKDWSGPVYVVNQYNQGGKFDEHKAVIGVNTEADAKAEYLSNYERGWQGGKAVITFANPAEFKKWAEGSVKGKAIDPRLPRILGHVAANKGVTFNKTTESGALMFSDTDSDRATSFTISKPSPTEFLKKLAEVRAKMEGTPEQKAAAEAFKKKKEEAAAKKKAQAEKPVVAPPEKKPETITGEEPKKPEQKPAEKPDSGPPAPAPKPETGEPSGPVVDEQGDAGTVGKREKRPWTEDRVRDHLAQSPAMRGAFARGLTLVEKPIGGGGMAASPDTNTFLIDAKATADQENRIDFHGGDGEKHLEMGILEELIHLDDIRASGRDMERIHKAMYDANPAIDGLAVWWPGTARWIMSAEWVRMIIQLRTVGSITEETFGPQGQSTGYKIPELLAMLKAEQAPIIERHIQKVMNLDPAKGLANGPKPPEIPPAPKPEPKAEPPAPKPAPPATKRPKSAMNPLDDATGKALDDAMGGLFAAKFSPAPTTEEDFAELVAPHQAGVEAGLKLPPSAEAEVQAEHDKSTAALLEAAKTNSPSFKAAMGKQTYLAGKLEGVKRSGPNYEAFTLLRNTALSEQKAIAPEKLASFITAAQALIKAGIDTPEKLAETLDERYQGKARPFSQGLWDMMGVVNPKMRATHDWPAIYGAIDKKKEAIEEMTPFEKVTQEVLTRLGRGDSVDRRALTAIATEHGLEAKEADEAAEVAIVIAAHHIATDAGTPQEKFDRTVDLYNRQPNLTAKTSTSKVNQAYSTPAPMAYAASVLADMTTTDSRGRTLYEPTAGNGMLLIEAKPSMTLANELDPKRAANLKDSGFPVTQNDATEYAPGVSVERVLANPPFGRLLTGDGTSKEWPLYGTDQTTHEIDHAISMKALSAMKDDGRAVLILGGKNKLLSGTDRGLAYAQGDGGKFWKALYDQYGVVDHFTVNGDLYSKQGAGWPIDVVVIAGRGQSQIQLPWGKAPRIIGSWDELRNELGRTDAERIDAGKYDVAKDRAETERIFDDIRGIAGAHGKPGPGELSEQPGPETKPGGEGSGVVAAPNGESALDSTEQPAGSIEPAGPGTGTVGPGTDSGGSVEQQQPVAEPVDLESFRVPYVPQNDQPSFKVFIPTYLEAPVRESLEKLKEKVGPLDEFVRKSLGYPEKAPMGQYFSAEQIDSLAAAINAVDEGVGSINGDQGGLGKGRVAAGMMAYALQKEWIPVFVTQDEKLYAEMIKDLRNIGRDDIVPMFTNSSINFEDEKGVSWKQGKSRPLMEQIIADGALPMGIKALFTSYTQIGTDVPPGWRQSAEGKAAAKGLNIKVPPGFKLKALQKIAPKTLFIADESHLASGESLAGHRLHELMGNAKGVYYSSATFAKRADSMGIYTYTTLSHATTDMQELIDAVKQGGTPIQQVVSHILSADGLYSRRERDFSGVVFKSHINEDTADRDRKLADNYTAGLREILDISNTMQMTARKFNQIMSKLGKRYSLKYAPKIESTNFSSKLHNCIKQYLFAIKAESLVQRAVAGVKTGFTNAKGETSPHKVVITFENTMEGPILDLKASKHPLTFQGMLLNYLDKQRILKPKGSGGKDEEPMVISDKPDPEFEHLSDDQLAGILIDDVHTNEEGQRVGSVNEKAATELFRRIMSEAFTTAAEKIAALDLADMPLSPIDYMKHRLQAEGITVGEMTGREAGIDQDGVLYDIKAPTKREHLQTIRSFNNTDMHVLLMNAAGSTGISLHSSVEFKGEFGQMPRAMLIGQSNLDINKFMQTLWRIDRTGQVHQPYYEQVLSALAAELRPAAINSKKMASLNANTTSNAQSEVSKGASGVNIFNQYGDEVVHNFLRADKDFLMLLALDKILDAKGVLYPLDAIRQIYPEDGKFTQAITGRVGVMPEYDARQFWDKVTTDYNALISYLNEIGENELTTDTMDLKAETTASKELTSGRPNPTSGFDGPSFLEKIKAEIGLKPLPVGEVTEMMKKLNGWETEKEWKAVADEWKKTELARQIEKAVTWKPEKEQALQQKWRDAEEAIRNSIGMIGHGLHIKTRRGVDGYGAITAVHLDLEHPLVPSKQMFEVHVNTTKRKIRIAASQLSEDARHASVEFASVYEATAERSNERYMITGNLLKAYLAIKDSAPTAKIVNYTTSAGEMKQGILMPVKFDPGQLAAKREVEDANQFKQLLDASRSVNAAGDVISMVKAPNGVGYVMRVPASKIMGGAYWRDPELQRLMDQTGGQFVERGNAMVGKFTDTVAVYNRLKAMGAGMTYREQSQNLQIAKFNPAKVAKAIYTDDVEPVAKAIGMSAKEALQILRKVVSPRSGVRADGIDAVMRALGKQYEEAYQTDRVLEAWNEAVRKMPRDEQIAFVDRVKNRQPQATPELQQLAETERTIDTDSWQAANNAWADWYKALGRTMKEPPLKWKEDHFRVLWKVIPGSTDDEKAAWIGKSRNPLRGSMGQHKQSTLDDMSEGLELGGVPYTYNHVEMFKRAQADLWKTTTILHLLAFMRRNGFMEFVKGPFPKAPEGSVAVDDAAFKRYFPASSGEGLIAAGQWFVEEGMGRLLNNYLSKDLIRQVGLGRGLIWLKNATTTMELSLSPFHAIFETLETVGSNIGLAMQKLVNRGIIGGSAKVAGEGLLDMIKAFGTPITQASLGAQFRKALVDPDAFFKTTEGLAMLKDYPNARDAADAIFAAGFKPPELEQDWRNDSVKTFLDALADLKAGASDNYIGAGLRAFPAANEMLMKPLFDKYIPNLKVAQFLKEFSEAVAEDDARYGKQGYYIDRSGKKWYRPYTRPQLARKVWDFVEDRFGEMNYDKVFWNRTFKSAMTLMFRSVTWKGGSVRAFGGAFSGQGKEFLDAFREKRAPELHRNMAWLFGMMLLTATLGTILMKTLTGRWPGEGGDLLTDLVFPQIDPKDKKIRASLPTYFKDLVHLLHAPTSYVTASLSGWIGRLADLWRNKDYYGVQIHDTDDPVVKQLLETGSYLGQTMMPFSIRGYKNLSAQDVGALRKALALAGVNPAPRFIGQSAAEKAEGAYWKGQRSEAGIRPDQMESKSEKAAIVSQIRHGDHPNLSAALASGAIKARDIKPLFQRAQQGPLVSGVSHMPLADAEKIYAKATATERVKLAPIMAQKRANAAKATRPAFTGF
jgi:hypothetical protein